jgi:hypothetical protein
VKAIDRLPAPTWSPRPTSVVQDAERAHVESEARRTDPTLPSSTTLAQVQKVVRGRVVYGSSRLGSLCGWGQSRLRAGSSLRGHVGVSHRRGGQPA